MAQGDIEPSTEKAIFGAPDLERIENELRQAIETELPYLSPEAREAVLQSRLKILSNSPTPQLIKEDLGEGARCRPNLF